MKSTKNCDQTRLIKGTYSCDNYADVYIGDCHQLQQKITENSSLEAVQFEAKASCNQFLYFVCWSDNAGLNGLLAELQRTNTIFSGTDAHWEVYPTGINFSSHTTRPSEQLVNSQLKKAHCKKWKKVTKGSSNGNRPFRSYPKINKAAHFIWFDSGKDSTPGAPFAGFNHDEFLIFRFPIKELFKEECHHCESTCECTDKCNCGPCTDAVKNERKVLEKAAMEKTFVIKGNENNARRCKTPYSEETCSQLDLPRLEPCFYLHWGDSSRDQMESQDNEVLYITACNPYANLRLRGITITNVTVVYKTTSRKSNETAIQISSQISTVENIQLVPNRLIQLGDLCGCSCASQAIYLSIQNAKPSDYEIVVEYCIDRIEINQDNTGKTRFPISIIKS